VQNGPEYGAAAMQNIDPVLFLEPILAIVMSIVAVMYWQKRRGFRGVVLLLSFIAYASAIAAKTAIQALTLNGIVKAFGSMSIELSLYYGLQTVFLEVGLAYVLSLYGVRRKNLKSSDGVPFGISLAFWENGVLLGLLSLFDLAVLYFLLASGTGLAQTVYSQIAATQSAYFLPPAALVPSVLLGTLERVSSMLAHIAWGALCVYAAATGRKRFLAYALPMGMVDALVPFASLNITVFEVGVFLLSVGFVLVAWRVAKQVQSVAATSSPYTPP